METIKLPGIKPILIRDIIYLSGDGVYSHIHRTDGPKLICSVPLKHISILLPTFVRIHKRFLINPIHVLGYERPTKKFPGELTITGGKVLGLSRRRWDEVHPLLSERPHSSESGSVS